MSTKTFADSPDGVKAALMGQLPRLIDCLFNGRQIQITAHEYRVGTHGSISIRQADGCYYNHETGEGGDLLTLIQHQEFQCIYRWTLHMMDNGHQQTVAAMAALSNLTDDPFPLLH